jgi:hypothetical protein
MYTFQLQYGPLPESLTLCRESVLKYYPDVDIIQFPAVENPLYESDGLRWQIMQEHDDVLYIDWDVLLSGPLTFKNNCLPSFMLYPPPTETTPTGTAQPDNCLMYSPDKKIFQAYEAERVRRGIRFETMGWFRKILRDKPHNVIPETEVQHLRVSGFDELTRQYKQLTSGAVNE